MTTGDEPGPRVQGKHLNQGVLRSGRLGRMAGRGIHEGSLRIVGLAKSDGPSEARGFPMGPPRFPPRHPGPASRHPRQALARIHREVSPDVRPWGLAPSQSRSAHVVRAVRGTEFASMGCFPLASLVSYCQSVGMVGSKQTQLYVCWCKSGLSGGARWAHVGGRVSVQCGLRARGVD